MIMGCTRPNSNSGTVVKTPSRSKFPVGSLSRSLSLLVLVSSATLLGACSYRPLQPYNTQQDLPEAVRVPEGYQAVLEATHCGPDRHLRRRHHAQARGARQLGPS